MTYDLSRMLEQMHEAGRLYYRTTGMPMLKHYLDEMPGVPLQNLWDDLPVLSNRSKEALGYPTQKPLALLDRIIKASSRPGDLVLDPFCGCGTAVESAQLLGRRWIGIDITALAIDVVANFLARLDITDITRCGNGIEAFQWLQQQKFDLLFLDIEMPKLSGLDYLKSSFIQPLVILTTDLPPARSAGGRALGAVTGVDLPVFDVCELLDPVASTRLAGMASGVEAVR